MTAVFLDTAGLSARRDEENDQWSGPARAAFARLAAARTPTITTTYVLAEYANAAARTPFCRDVSELRDRLEAGGRLVFPTEDDWREAWEDYRRGQSGLVDHLSFAVMRRLGL